MNLERLEKQMSFLREIEKLKLVYRRNSVLDRSRQENSAEHSWHIALMALVLAEHADEEDIDISKVVRQLLVHDLVEIYAGDTWLYDEAAMADKEEKERASAQELFALLPSDQAEEFQMLWEEFETRKSPEAKFAAAVDAIQPLINFLQVGAADYGNPPPARSLVLKSKAIIKEGSEKLWDLAQKTIDECVKRGLYANA